MGLSFEESALPLLARYGHSGDLVNLLRELGPGVLRLGGVSADADVAWAPRGTPPQWAHTAISPADLAGLAALARKTGWLVLLTVNLGHYDPQAAAEEVAAAHAVLKQSLLGVEVGNEPDRYEREGLRGAGWSFGQYTAQFDAYRAAIRRVAPGVSIVAPGASSGIPPLPWVRDAATLKPALLTDHYYPLSSCGGFHVSIAEMMGSAVRSEESAMLARLLGIEHQTGHWLRLDESNDISCRGEAGVSNTLASALWAVDWTVRAMQVGLNGLNFHDLLTEQGAYSPLVLPAASQSAGQPATGAADRPSQNTELAPVALHANPEWYALLLVSRVIGDSPLPTHVKGGSDLSAGVFVPAGRDPGPMRISLVDFDGAGARPLSVHLDLPKRFVSGTVMRLTGPSAATQHGVALGGEEVNSTGAWSPKLPLATVSAHAGSLSVQMPPSSAALVTLYPRTRR